MKPVILLLTGIICSQLSSAVAEDSAGPVLGCEASVLLPERFEIVTEQVVDQPERMEIVVLPAEYEMVPTEMLVRAAWTERRIVPAQFTTETEQVLVRPERTETIVIPAEYETHTERVLLRPAETRWDVVTRDPEDRSACMRSLGAAWLCPVEVPPVYETVTKTEIVTPERTETRVIPAEFRTLVKQIETVPERIETVEHPAEYETVMVETLVVPAREEVRIVPATYRTVEKRVSTGGGMMSTRPVVCDTALSEGVVTALQNALTEAGHPVEADGVLGPATLAALAAFQSERGLPMGHLTEESVTVLGMSLGR